MFAIIKTGGKQYIVRPGDKIKIEKLDASEGKEVSFEALLVSDKETLVGTPYVKGYEVKAKILGQGKDKKIIVYKYKPKKRYHKKQGHRQLYTEVEILTIVSQTKEGKIGAKKIAETAKPKTAKTVSRKAKPVSATIKLKGRSDERPMRC